MAQALTKWIAVVAVIAACGKGDKGSPRDKVVDAWKAAGLSPSEFTAATEAWRLAGDN